MPKYRVKVTEAPYGDYQFTADHPPTKIEILEEGKKEVICYSPNQGMGLGEQKGETPEHLAARRDHSAHNHVAIAVRSSLAVIDELTWALVRLPPLSLDFDTALARAEEHLAKCQRQLTMARYCRDPGRQGDGT